MVEGQFDGSGVEDGDFGGVGGGDEVPADDAGEKGDADVVAAGVAARVGVDADEVGELDGEARLLDGLAGGGLLHRLADLDETAWEGPLALEGVAPAADQDDAPSDGITTSTIRFGVSGPAKVLPPA